MAVLETPHLTLIVCTAAFALSLFFVVNALVGCLLRMRLRRIDDKIVALRAAPRVSAAARSTPVTLVTGFLGAGKTTLLNVLLRSPPGGARLAVIENERGALALDHTLLRGASSSATNPRVVVLANGCICCSASSGSADEVERTLDRLLEVAAGGGDNASSSDSNSGGYAADHIIVETSGLADPAPLVEAFLRIGQRPPPAAAISSSGSDGGVAPFMSRFHLDGIVTLVDAAHVHAHLAPPASPPSGSLFSAFSKASPEAARQVAFADVIIINKTDVATPSAVAAAIAAITATNPSARILTAVRAEVDPAAILHTGAFDPTRAAALLRPLLEQQQQQGGVGAGAAGEGVVLAPLRASHDSRVATLTLHVSSGMAVPQDALLEWLATILERHGRALYRTKGMVHVFTHEERAITLMIIQGVHEDLQIAHAAPLAAPLAASQGTPHGGECEGGAACHHHHHHLPAHDKARASTSAHVGGGTGLVLLGRDLPEAALRASFERDVLRHAVPHAASTKWGSGASPPSHVAEMTSESVPAAVSGDGGTPVEEAPVEAAVSEGGHPAAPRARLRKVGGMTPARPTPPKPRHVHA